jgi:cold shock CspA family protein
MEQQVTGQIANVIKQARYGFIHDGTGKRYFLHQSAMRERRPIPPQGTRVSFFIAPPLDKEKLERAVNVEVL